MKKRKKSFMFLFHDTIWHTRTGTALQELMSQLESEEVRRQGRREHADISWRVREREMDR